MNPRLRLICLLGLGGLGNKPVAAERIFQAQVGGAGVASHYGREASAIFFLHYDTPSTGKLSRGTLGHV